MTRPFHDFEDGCRCDHCKQVLSRVSSRKKARYRFGGIVSAPYIEASYVYAPYVPLQVTQTIFSPEDCQAKAHASYVRSTLASVGAGFSTSVKAK